MSFIALSRPPTEANYSLLSFIQLNKKGQHFAWQIL